MKLASDLKSLMTLAPPLTLAVAESLTCGQVQARVGAISGASTFFLGGVTAYTLDQKVKLLAVRRVPAKRVNAVSESVASEMAIGAGRLFSSDLAAATTGYAEPAPASGIEQPFAWWAIAHRINGHWNVARSGRIECPGARRSDVQRMVAEAVIGELEQYLAEWRAGRVAARSGVNRRKRKADRRAH